MICKICGLECKSGAALAKHIHIRHNTTSKEYYDMYLKNFNEGICPICNKDTPFLGFSKGYQHYCSAKCAQNGDNNVFKVNNPRKSGQSTKKYSSETINFTCNLCGSNFTTKRAVSNHIIKKHKMTLQEYWLKYQSGKCICGKDTKISVLGFEKYCSAKCRNLDLYNTETNIDKTERKHLHNTIIRTEFENTHNVIGYCDAIQLYGQGWLSIKDEIPTITIANKTYITDITKIVDYCAVNHYRNNNIEQHILDSITQVYSGEILTHTRKIISPLELDFYIPELQLAIEYNGTYWHSIEVGLDSNYHLNKSLLCREKEIRLIHIYGFENLASYSN